MLSYKVQQTFPSFRQVSASSPTPGLLERFLMVMAAGAASCQLTPASAVISSSWWMTETPLAPLFAMSKTHPCLAPIWLSSLHPLPISITYCRIALITSVQLLMLKLEMKRVLLGTDALFCASLTACVQSLFSLALILLPGDSQKPKHTFAFILLLVVSGKKKKTWI